MKTRKKWLRKTTAICTAALLGTAAIPSTAFAADSYASIEKDAWAKKVTEMASSYATSIEESQSLMSGMQSDMKCSLFHRFCCAAIICCCMSDGNNHFIM